MSGYVRDLVARQVHEFGIVVWYDPERQYETLAAQLAIPDAQVLRFEGSLFRLRAQVNPILEFVTAEGRFTEFPERRPRLVVYVPRARTDLHDGLVELDRIGVIMEPGAPALPRNIRLEVVARHALRKLMAADQVEAICRKVAEGLYRLDDLDRLAEQGPGPGVAGLLLIFGTADVTEVTLRFLTDPSVDESIVAKGVMPELAALLARNLEIEIPGDAPPGEARRATQRLLLLTDFVAALPSEAIPPEVAMVPLPADAAQREAARAIVSAWRNRADLRAALVAAAHEVEREVGADRFDLSLDALAASETFPCHEVRLLRLAEAAALAGDVERVLKLAGRRRLAFWPSQDGALLLRWHLVRTACLVFRLARQIRDEVKSAPRVPSTLVRCYAEGDRPWCELDTQHRHLERQYAAFELEPGGDHEGLERLMQLARREYMETLGSMAEAVSTALEVTGFEWGDLPRQSATFTQCVQITGSAGAKTAYLWVDALRYEMARELLDGLRTEFLVELKPAVAQLPTITPVGMAALLPGTADGMRLVEAGKGTVGVEVGGVLLKTRAERLAALHGKVPGPLLALKLEEALKPSRATRAKIEEARFIVITSQELDSLSEDEHLHLARQLMDSVLDHLRRAIRNLAALGVQRIVVAADHGHIFGEEIESGMKIDPPGGTCADLHRRVWIGKGGETAPGVLRVPAARVGLGGDLDLVFPRGVACFRVKGSARQFFHGGLSLQEVVIPVGVLQARAAPASAGRPTVELFMERRRITTRFFSVEVRYQETGLFAAGPLRVKVIGRANRQEVAAPAMAAYGFEDGTREISLQAGRPNPVTMMLTEESEGGSLSVHVLDAATQVELARLEGIEVRLTI